MAAGNSRCIRVLHITGTLRRAGAETWLIELLRHMDRNLFQMDFLVEARTADGYELEAESLGARVVECPGFSNPLRFGWNLWRLLRRSPGYGIVHAHNNYHAGFSLLIAALAGVRVRIAHSHGNDAGKGWYRFAMRRGVDRFGTAGVAVSPISGKSFFGSAWNRDPRWKLLACGIDLNRYHRHPRMETRVSLAIPQDAFVIGHAGRFHRDKNHEQVIDVAAGVLQRRPETILLLAGDGTNCARLRKACSEAGLDGHVRILGARTDVPALLSAMDVFLFPSQSEGLGLACVEAQAAGLPVVASTNVPEDACVMAALVRRVELASPVATWVDAVLDAGRAPRLDRRVALEQVGKSIFNIHRSAADLSKLYIEALNGVAGPFPGSDGAVCPR